MLILNFLTMKKLFNSLAVAVLVCAGVSAYATARNTVLDVVFYETGSDCVEARATKCNFTGTPACEVLTFTPQGGSLGFQQIFAAEDPINPLKCATAYRETAQ